MKSFACPHCGEDVPAKRRSCPHCGASENDGWGEDDTDLEDGEFDYDEYVEREFGQSRDFDQPRSPGQLKAARTRFVIWVIIASLLLSVLLPLFL